MGYWAELHMQVDAVMACPARRGCSWFANQSLPAYFYQFVHVPPDAGEGDGSYHGAELPYLFKYRPSLVTFSDVHLADVVAGLWREVASGEVESWPRFEKQTAAGLRLGPGGNWTERVQHLRGPQRDCWDELFFASHKSSTHLPTATFIV